MILQICWDSPGSLNLDKSFLKARSYSMPLKSRELQNSWKILSTFSLFLPKYSPMTSLSSPSMLNRYCAIIFSTLSSLFFLSLSCSSNVFPLRSLQLLKFTPGPLSSFSFCSFYFSLLILRIRAYIARAGFLLNLRINYSERLLLSYRLSMDKSQSSRLDCFFFEIGNETLCLLRYQSNFFFLMPSWSDRFF